jgi:hypothetical protein
MLQDDEHDIEIVRERDCELVSDLVFDGDCDLDEEDENECEGVLLEVKESDDVRVEESEGVCVLDGDTVLDGDKVGDNE